MRTAIRYVNFQEGLREAYENLKVKDKDTLYFVMDSVDSKTGTLYLGNKLIDGGLTHDTIINNIELVPEEDKNIVVPSIKLLEQYAQINEVKKIIEIEVENQITTGGTGRIDGGNLDGPLGGDN